MKAGIVGHEAAKFTPVTEAAARRVIRWILSDPIVTAVSGRCHLGGIDIWAEEEADRLGRDKIIHPPTNLSWETGFKVRNILIAQDSDEVHCIVVSTYPPAFRSKRFAYCYHCGTKDHVKSGGCWTAKHAEKLGKKAFWHVIAPDGSISSQSPSARTEP